MEQSWSVLFYTDVHGNQPVAEFIDKREKRDQAKIAWYLDLLAEFGLDLKRPHVEPLRHGLWELRPGKCRLIYYVHTGRQIIVLHGVYKQTRKIPDRDIETAERRLADFLSRE